MAADLAVLPHTGIFTQLCGDAHVRNLGAFAAPDGRLVFDINDFDETIRGPFEWDVKRMATSIILAGREAGSKSSACGEAAGILLRGYRRSMHAFARMPVMDVARFQVHRLQRDRTAFAGAAQGRTGNAAVQPGAPYRTAARRPPKAQRTRRHLTASSSSKSLCNSV